MELAAFFTDLFGPDGGIVLALLVLSGLGMIGIMAWSLVQGRSDIRRRAQEGLTAPVAAKNDPKAQNSASLERLVGYLETTFSGGDPHERRLIRLQLVQAGFFDQRAVAIFFGARIAAAAVMGVGTLLAVPVLRPEMTSANLWLATIGLAILGYFAPSFYIKRRIAQRIDQHRMGFPDFMDLMVVCAEAGLSMEAAIDRLPDGFRAVFVLREVQQLSVAETAACLDLEPATVKTRLHRARAFLREDLAKRLHWHGTSAFEFLGARCDRLVAKVIQRLGLEHR